MEPEVEDAVRDEIIRSAHSSERAFVMYVNGTTRIVSIYWIDFNGRPTFYVRLVPNAVVEINTFRSHAWIFRDTITGEHFQVQRQNVLWAEPHFTRSERNQNEIVPARRRFYIHFPIRTLREYMLWYLMRKLKNTSEDMVQQFDVPKVLKDDLIDVLHKVVAFRTAGLVQYEFIR